MEDILNEVGLCYRLVVFEEIGSPNLNWDDLRYSKDLFNVVFISTDSSSSI